MAPPSPSILAWSAPSTGSACSFVILALCEYYPIAQMTQNLLAACQLSFEALLMPVCIEALFVLNCQLAAHDILTSLHSRSLNNVILFRVVLLQCWWVKKKELIPGLGHCVEFSPWLLVTSHTPKVCPLGVMACFHSPSLRGSGCDWSFSGRVSCPEGVLLCPLSCWERPGH